MKIFIGKVVGLKSQKTATVSVSRIVAHPIYRKRFKKTRNYLVHDEVGVHEGDTVKFVTTKPISKLKKWKIVGIVEEVSKKKGGDQNGSTKKRVGTSR